MRGRMKAHPPPKENETSFVSVYVIRDDAGRNLRGKFPKLWIIEMDNNQIYLAAM